MSLNNKYSIVVYTSIGRNALKVLGKSIIDLRVLEIADFLCNGEGKLRKKTVGSYCLRRKILLQKEGKG